MFRYIAYILMLVCAVSASTLKYDTVYNKNSGARIATMACSDGSNGLLTKYNNPNLTTNQLAGNLKSGVFLAASPHVTGWNSPNCGKCYRARLRNSTKSFLYVAVDVANPSIVSGQDAFSTLANPSAGLQTVYITEMPPSSCFK